LSLDNDNSDFKGTGLPGGIKYAGIGTVVDQNAVWNGVLKPGDVLQFWENEDDYQKFQEANIGKKVELTSFGHSAIFLGYVYDNNGNIEGMNIYVQGTGWDFPSGSGSGENHVYIDMNTTGFNVIIGGTIHN